MKLISTKDYLLLIDEVTGFKNGDWNYEIDNTIQIYQFSYDIEKYPGNKIIAYYPLSKEATELDLPLLPNPFKTYRVGRKQKRAILDEKGVEIGIFKTGSEEQAQKYCDYLNSKQFSLEDMVNAFNLGVASYKDSLSGQWSHSEGRRRDLKERFIQSLSTQQLPKEFIPEWQWKCPLTGVWLDKPDLSVEVCKEKRIKRKYIEILKQELVGTYKY